MSFLSFSMNNYGFPNHHFCYSHQNATFSFSLENGVFSWNVGFLRISAKIEILAKFYWATFGKY